VPVINKPEGVTRTRSKAWLATLSDVPRPATLVTASRGSAGWFARNLGTDVVVKPVDRSGGRGVRKVPFRRLDLLDEAMDLAWCAGDTQVVVQEYLPEAADGEKRLFWVDGRILGAYLRMRGRDGFRHNLVQGGRPQPCAVDDADRAIARAIGPHLRRNGIRIAGLDVIGGRLVEVNTLNPGGIHHAERFRDPDRPSIAAEAVRLLLPHPGSKPIEAGSP
jgi:Glutathione synthase/Ribosomal protein S6 modification enzyme (glutaminyl transferase)